MSALDHEENRKKVCAPCGKKIIFGKKGVNYFKITQNLDNLLKLHVNRDFDLLDKRYPTSICGTCQVVLREYNRGITLRSLPVMPDYNTLIKRSDIIMKSTCCCFICILGRNTCTLKQTIKTEDKNLSEEICKKCFNTIGKGKRHSCSIINAQKNASKIVESLPEKQQEKIASKIIKSNSDAHQNRNSTLSLSTGGTPLKVILHPSIEKKTKFSVESLNKFKTVTGSSLKQMETLTNFIRSCAGKKSIPSYYRQQASENSKSLQNIYKEGSFLFDIEENKKAERPIVYADASELLDAVIHQRQDIGNNYSIKIMADGGQGFFKICMSIFPEDYLDGLGDMEEQEKKRSTYSAGGSIEKDFKLSGVNKLIMVCIVPQIKETYDNMKLLFDVTNINNIPFRFVSDFKLLLIINGQQTASSTYPSPYCFISLNDLKLNKYIERENDTACDTLNTSEECLRLKTYGDIREAYKKYCLLGNNKKLAKECNSTVNLPLFHEEDDVYVIEKCIVPELHILQGFVNHLFWNGLVPIVGRERALNWPKKLNLIPKNYHGDCFEGNACRKLTKEADKINDEEVLGDVPFLRLLPLVNVFKSLNKVIKDCFSTRKVGENLDIHLNELKKMFLAIEMGETLKIHVALHHLKHSLHFLPNNGLGIWSEQSGESIHREFLKFWSRYKINILEDKSYANHLKRAVTEFSSEHL